MRTQPQFDSEHERRRAQLMRDFKYFIFGAAFWLLIFTLSLLAIGLITMDSRINHW